MFNALQSQHILLNEEYSQTIDLRMLLLDGALICEWGFAAADGSAKETHRQSKAPRRG
jgi:hypothetical protein